MVHIRQPFFSIVTAIIFTMFGLLFGLDVVRESAVTIGGIKVGASAAWALTGVMFLMAYFSLVHIKYR